MPTCDYCGRPHGTASTCEGCGAAVKTRGVSSSVELELERDLAHVEWEVTERARLYQWPGRLTSELLGDLAGIGHPLIGRQCCFTENKALANESTLHIADSR